MASKAVSVRCPHCHKRGSRVFMLWCECEGPCEHTAYGACPCGGQFVDLETYRQCQPVPEGSHLERSLFAALCAAGIEPPWREWRITPERQWRADFAYPERRLLVEVEGGTWRGSGRHVRGAGFEADCIKYAEAAIKGFRVIRVTSSMVKDGRAVSLIQRALEASA